jgi:hypothetical protein
MISGELHHYNAKDKPSKTAYNSAPNRYIGMKRGSDKQKK